MLGFCVELRNRFKWETETREDNVRLYWSSAKDLEPVDMAPQRPHQLQSIQPRDMTGI